MHYIGLLITISGVLFFSFRLQSLNDTAASTMDAADPRMKAPKKIKARNTARSSGTTEVAQMLTELRLVKPSIDVTPMNNRKSWLTAMRIVGSRSPAGATALSFSTACGSDWDERRLTMT